MRQVFEKVFAERQYITSVCKEYRANVCVVLDDIIHTVWIGYYDGDVTICLSDINAMYIKVKDVDHALECFDIMFEDGFAERITSHADAIISNTNIFKMHPRRDRELSQDEKDKLVEVGKSFGRQLIPEEIEDRAQRTFDKLLQYIHHNNDMFHRFFEKYDVNTLFERIDCIFTNHTSMDKCVLVA